MVEKKNARVTNVMRLPFNLAKNLAKNSGWTAKNIKQSNRRVTRVLRGKYGVERALVMLGKPTTELPINHGQD